MDPFEDDHIVARPTRVMAVALRKGERPPFARPLARGGGETAAPPPRSRGRAALPRRRGRDPLARLPAAGRAGQLLPPARRQAARRLVLGAGVHRGGVRRVVPAGGPDQVERCTSSRWPTRRRRCSTTRSPRPRSPRTASSSSCARSRRCSRRRSRRPTSRRSSGARSTSPGLVYRVSPREEWRQIFADAWRWYRDFFYDQDMHGRDWKAIREKYRPCVEEIRTRQQLNWVLSEMVGELCVSHTYVSGGDIGPTGAPPEPGRARGAAGGRPRGRRAERPLPLRARSTGRRRTSATSRRRSRAPTST